MNVVRIIVTMLSSFLFAMVVISGISKFIKYNYLSSLVIGGGTIVLLIQTIHLFNFIYSKKYKGTVVRVAKTCKVFYFRLLGKDYDVKRFFIEVKTEADKTLILNNIYIDTPQESLTLIDDVFSRRKKPVSKDMLLFRLLIVTIYILASLVFQLIVRF